MRTDRGPDRLLAVLRDPASLAQLDAPAWSLLIRQARHAGLLARLALLVQDADCGAAVPQPAAAHLESAALGAQAQSIEVQRELEELRKALERAGLPLVLLKGAAYLAQGLAASRGRMFTDVDILVPKPQLAEAEGALMRAGWKTTVTSAYDQRYYRRWTHELPPMQHMLRQSVVDVHHTLLPQTARARPNAAKLFERLVDVPGQPGLRTLCPADMVLHSATHLFYNDDLSHALRDLVDLDLLLREFGRDAAFGPALHAHAAELDLQQPLHLALRWTRRVLATPVPPPPGRPERGAWSDLWMDALWQRALRGQHPTLRRPSTDLALFALYVRAHWLRMPPWLLLPHLAVKGWRRLVERPDQPGG
jgi:hypothetical protein